MAIYKGSTKIKKIYKGGIEVKKVYKGSQLVFSSGKLPSEYQEVEYIKINRYTGINTNYYPNQNTSTMVKFTPFIGTNVYWENYIYGGSTSGSENAYELYINRIPQFEFHYGSSIISYDRTPNENDIFKVEREKTHISLSINDTIQFEAENTPQTFISPNYLYIGILKRSDQPYYSPFAFNLYSMTIKENDIMVRNFVPCYHKADNIIGLYDTINNAFYTNVGIGSFGKGPDV